MGQVFFKSNRTNCAAPHSFFKSSISKVKEDDAEKMNYKRKNKGHRFVCIVQAKGKPNAIPTFTTVLRKSREENF